MKEFKGTKGEWWLPHFADPACGCDCGFVLNESVMGAIATVHYHKSDKDENPPLEEAIYNARLISASPDLLMALQKLIDVCEKVQSNCKLGEYYDALKKSLDDAKVILDKILL